MAKHVEITSEDEVLVMRNAEGRPVAVPHAVVMEADRPYRAYYLHLGGMTWEGIKDLEEYPTISAVKADIKRYLDEGRSLITEFSRAQLMERELARIDVLQAAVWEGAKSGHLPSVNTAHSLIMSRVKLLRLDEDVRDDAADVEGRTVVVPSDDDGYTAVLEAASKTRKPNGG